MQMEGELDLQTLSNWDRGDQSLTVFALHTFGPLLDGLFCAAVIFPIAKGNSSKDLLW